MFLVYICNQKHHSDNYDSNNKEREVYQGGLNKGFQDP